MFGEFELTRQCNFNCPMCFVRKKSVPGLDAKTYGEYAKIASEKGLLELSLTGGEVFTRKDFFEIYDKIYELGILISIMSNGYLLDEKKIKHLRQKPPHHIYITLYGASNETYYNICGVRNGATVVYQNISKLLNAGIRLVLQVTLTTVNIKDYESILQFADTENIPIRTNYHIYDPIRNADTNQEDIKIARLQLKDVPAELLEYERVNRSHPHEIVKQCQAIKNSFCVTAEGQLQICQRAVYPNVNIENNDLIFALQHLRELAEQRAVPAKCKQCNKTAFCNLCLGGLYQLKSGNIIPYDCFCEYAIQTRKL